MDSKTTSFTFTVLAKDQTKFGLFATFKESDFQSLKIALFNFEFEISLC